MKRTYLLIAACTTVVAGAVSLRIAMAHRAKVAPAGNCICGSAAPWIGPEPRDYCLRPRVAPDEVTAGPRRIVSLAPSVTETICALGLMDRLVGRTQFCVYPPSVAATPVVGGIMDTNFEKIRALAPDLVLTTFNSAAINSRLAALGIAHASLPHESLEDVFTAIRKAGELCQRPATAAMLEQAVRADIRRLTLLAREHQVERRRVLVVLGDLNVPPSALWVAGPGSFLNDLLDAAGQENAAAGSLSAPYGEMPLERLLIADPDLIFTFPARGSAPAGQASMYVAEQALTYAADQASMYDYWSRIGPLRALRDHRVYPLGGPDQLSAGPRIALQLHRLIKGTFYF